MADPQRVSLDEIVVHFQELEDPRSTVNRRHPLVSVLVIALLAVLAGAGGPTAIARWAALKEEFLLQVLDLPNGVPRKDVFRRVLMVLKPAAFQACFARWLQSLRSEAVAETGVEQPILAVDGKTARRSHDRTQGLGALHSVSVWASEYGLSLGIVTKDVMRGLAIADQIPTGIVHINDQTVNDEAVAPFGGVKASGTGSRFGGAAANLANGGNLHTRSSGRAKTCLREAVSWTG